jgi:hypothetical protein
LSFSSILFLPFYEIWLTISTEVDQHARGYGFGRSNPASQESGVEPGTPCSSVALDVFEIEDAWCGKLEDYPHGEIPHSIQS